MSSTTKGTAVQSSSANIRRRRPIGLDNPSLLNPGRSTSSSSAGSNGNQQQTGIDGSNGNNNGAPTTLDAPTPAIMLFSIILLSCVPRVVFGISGAVPLESMIPVKFALANVLVEGTQSYTVASGLWLDAIVLSVVALFAIPSAALLDFSALLGLVVASFPSQIVGSKTKYLSIILMLGVAFHQAEARQVKLWEFWKVEQTTSAEPRPLLWTVSSALAVGLCVARCLRWSSGFSSVRLGAASVVTSSVSKILKTLGQIPLVAALVRILFSPFIAVAQSVGLKWPVALALWFSSMIFQWSTHVSEGGILIFASFIIGLLNTMLEDRRSGSLGAKLGFTAVVCAVNAVVWLISPPRALAFLANAVVSAYLILYVSYLRTPTSAPASATKTSSACKKDNGKGNKSNKESPEPSTPTTTTATTTNPQQQQVEIYTSLSTVVLMLLWLAMLGLDLTQQVASGWPIPTTYNLFLNINTIGYGMVMLVTALFDLVHKELHEGHAARLQREKVEALSNTLKNSTQNNTKIVITKGNKKAEKPTAAIEKEEGDSDGGEAAAPSNSNTPLLNNTTGTPIPENSSSSSLNHGGEKGGIDGDNVTRGNSIHSVSSEPTSASHQSDTLEESTTPPTSTEASASTKKGVVSPPTAIGGSRGESPVQPSTFATGNSFDSATATAPTATTTNTSAPTPNSTATKDKKKSKAEIERERKEWQEAQLRAELGDSLEEKKEKNNKSQVSTTPNAGSGKKDTNVKKNNNNTTASKESPATPRGGKSDDQLAALRAAAAKEQELKERLESERRERERKLQEEQQKKEKERERQEAVRQKELEKKNKEALESQRKKEKELELQREKEAKLRQEEKVRKEKEKIERQAAKAKKDEEDAKKAAIAAAIAKASEDSLPGSTAPAGPPPADAVNLRAPVAGKSMAETLRERQKATASVQGGDSSPVKSTPQVVEAKAPIKTEVGKKGVKAATTAVGQKHRHETPTTPLTPTQYPASKGPPMAICSVDDLSGSPTESLAVPLPRSSQARRHQQVPPSPNTGGAPLPPAACDDDDDDFGLGGVGNGSSNNPRSSALLPMAIDADPEPTIAANFITPPMVAADLGSGGVFTPSAGDTMLPAATTLDGGGALLKSTPPVGVFSEDDAENTPVYRSPNSKTEAAGRQRVTPPHEMTDFSDGNNQTSMSANDRHDYLFALLGGGNNQAIEEEDDTVLTTTTGTSSAKQRDDPAPPTLPPQESAGSFTVTSSNAPTSATTMEMGSPIFGGGAGIIGGGAPGAGRTTIPTSADDEDFWNTLNQGVSGLLAESGNNSGTAGNNLFAPPAQSALRESPPAQAGGAFLGGGAPGTFGGGGPLLSMGNNNSTVAPGATDPAGAQQQTFQVLGSNGQVLQYAAPPAAAGSNQQQFFVAQAAVGQNGQPMYYIPQNAAAGYTNTTQQGGSPMFVLQQPAGGVAPPPPPPPPPASTSPSNAATNAYQTMTMPPQYSAPASGGNSPQHGNKS